LPLLLVLLAMIGFGYPLALIFGLPLAKRDMNDLRKWEKEVVWARATTNLSNYLDSTTSTGSDIPKIYEFSFEGLNQNSILIKDNKIVDFDYSINDNKVLLKVDSGSGTLAEQKNFAVTWDKSLVKISDTVYSFEHSIDEKPYGRAVFIGSLLAKEAVVFSDYPPDGARARFSFRQATGPLLLDNHILVKDKDYRQEKQNIILNKAAKYGAKLRRISGDYAVLDAKNGLLVFAKPPNDIVRAASSVLRMAEKLKKIDSQNNIYAFSNHNIVEFDKNRHIFVGNRELSNDALRPKERIDGKTSVFSFKAKRGLVVLDSKLLKEAQDYDRNGEIISLTKTPSRNAKLRLYPDYFVIDPKKSEIQLSFTTDEDVWTSQYSFFSKPACGNTLMQCFFALPQHPVPFPHWIALRVKPFFSKFPISDQRNIIRAILYTTLGTLSALVLGGLVGIILAILFVLFRPLERALLPWTIASQTIPIIALVPVLLLVLGNFGITIQTSLLPTAIIGAYICFFPVVVSTVKGLRAVDPLTLDLMKSYAASPLEVFAKVRFPAAVPFFFTGIKLGAAAALLGALVAETESNNARGLGFQILGQVQSGNVADVWILLIISGILGIAIVRFVGFLQQIFAPWEHS